MPYLKVQTNQPLEAGAARALMSRLSATVAAQLGKPERYVMIALEPAAPMLFAGNDQPLAYLELKSIGLPESATPELSQALCGVIEQALNVKADRIYIEFASASPHLWGWNRSTF